MAGSGKRGPHSVIRPPLVGPPVITPQPKVVLAVRQVRPRHTSSFIGTPVVNPGLIYPQAKTTLASRRRFYQRPFSALRPPAIVAAGLIYATARVSVAQLDRRRLHVNSQRGTPIVNPFVAPGFVPAPALVQFVKRRAPRPGNAAIRTPIVNPAPPPAPPQVHLVSRVKRPNQPHPIIGVPVTAPPSPAYIPAPAQIRLVARSQKFRPTSHWVLAPTVVNPAIIFPAAHVALARRSKHLPGAIALRGVPIVSPFIPPVVNVQGGTDWASEIMAIGN